MTAVAPDVTDVTTPTEQKNGKQKRGRKIAGVPTTIAGVDVPALPKPHTPHDEAQIQQIAMKEIVWTPLNPRKQFDPTALQQLADSIRVRGLLQPIIVRTHPLYTMAAEENARPDGVIKATGAKRTVSVTGPSYEGYIGERRYRAHQLLGAEYIRVIVREANDVDVRHAATVENLQRADLAPMEEARSYRDLLADRPDLSVAEIAALVSKDVAYVHRRLVLNDLPEQGQQMLEAGDLPFSTALELARLSDAAMVAGLLKRATTNLKHRMRLSADEVRREASQAMRLMAQAPFSPKDPDLVPSAGACLTCPKRTGNAATLFPDLQGKDDRCTDGACWQSKVAAFVTLGRPKVAKKAEKMGLQLRAISGHYGDRRKAPSEDAPLQRDHYMVLKEEGQNADRDCMATMLGYVVESDGPYGLKIGETHRICTSSECKIHRYTTSGGATGSQLEAKKGERKANAESDVRKQALRDGLKKLGWPAKQLAPNLTELRVVAAHILDRLYQDIPNAICRDLGLEFVQHKEPTHPGDKAIDGNNYDGNARSYHGAIAAMRHHIDNLGAAELMSFMVYMALFGSTQTRGSSDPTPSARLEAFAKRHDIPIAKMRSERMKQWAADEKGRAEKRLAAEKRKKEKEARDAAKAAGQTDAA
jgi:ParB/RepB/Spo0J family partition protein